MESNVEYKLSENIIHAKYTNLYYSQGKFLYLTIDDNPSNFLKLEVCKKELPILKTLGGPEHSGQQSPDNFTISPTHMAFQNKEKLQLFVDNLNCLEISGNTLHFSHYYDHNIAHGLYDALYPIYLAYLNFFDRHKNAAINMFLNLLVVNGWRMPKNYTATRDWVLNVFKDFCYGGEFIIKNSTPRDSNIKFNCLIVGAERVGISSTNKLGIMPGKSKYALEKLRNRFFKIYKIIEQKRNNINILFTNSARHTQEEKKTFEQLMDYLIKKKFYIRHIDWKDIKSFKEQLKIMNETDIQISSAGSAMLNFPFMNKNSININLGVKSYTSRTTPTLLETNICLLSNEIYTDFYDIYKHKEVKYEPLKNMLDNNINNIHQHKILTTEIPIYTQKWRELCVKENMDDIINKMNMDVSDSGRYLASRFPDVWIQINNR